jgi:hypothetical protein
MENLWMISGYFFPFPPPISHHHPAYGMELKIGAYRSLLTDEKLESRPTASKTDAAHSTMKGNV